MVMRLAMRTNAPGHAQICARPCTNMRPAMHKYAPGHAQICARPCTNLRLAMHKYAPGHAQICAQPCTNMRLAMPKNAHGLAQERARPPSVAGCWLDATLQPRTATPSQHTLSCGRLLVASYMSSPAHCCWLSLIGITAALSSTIATLYPEH